MSILTLGYSKTSSQNATKLITNIKNISYTGSSKTTYMDERIIPGRDNTTGYINGYEAYTITEQQRIVAGLDVTSREVGANTYNHTRYQSTADYDMDNFKYGLDNNKDNFKYEDPALLGFELYFDDIDNTSPFYYDNTKNKVYNFLNNYSDIPEIANRIDIFKEFKNRFFEIFNSLSESGNNKKYSKNYYINEIKGTNLLNKRVVNYPEDKITITMTEDITMSAQYLAELYNNLYYSYKDNRIMIPEHLLRFDLYIKINDIRKFRIYSEDSTTIDPKKSVLIYVLHDCTFNFFESKNTEDDIKVGGFGDSLNSTAAILSFDIHYKSVSKRFEPVLKNNALSIYNKEYGLYDNAKNNDNLFFKNEKSADDLDNWNINYNWKFANSEQKYGNSTDSVKSILNLTGKSSLINDITGVVTKNVSNLVSKIKSDVIAELKEKRNDLINRFISQVSYAASIKRYEKLGNVYKGDNHVSMTLSNKIKTDVVNDLENTKNSILSGTKSALTEYIANFDKILKI
jgi:hypothetical protein